MRHSFRCNLVSVLLCFLFLSTPLLPEDGTADIQVDVEGPPEALLTGEAVEFRITVRNNGPSTAEGVDLANFYTPGALFVSVFPESANCSQVEGSQVLCALGRLESGQSASVELELKPQHAGGLVVESEADAANLPDPNTENNSGRKEVEVIDPGADVKVFIEYPDEEVAVGEKAPFFITVYNLGPSVAEGVDLGISFNETASFVYIESPAGDCHREGRHLVCPLGVLEPEAAFTVELKLKAEHPGSIVVEAGADASNLPDPNTENNSDRAEIRVEKDDEGADIAVDFDASDESFRTGDTLTCFVKVKNNGPQQAAGVDLAVEFSQKASFDSADSEAADCDFDGHAVHCALGTLEAEESVLVRLKLKAEEAGTLVMEAFADPSNVDDPDPENNSARKTVRIFGSGADLAVTLSDEPDPVSSGGPVRYQVKIRNHGPTVANQVYLEAILPEHGELASTSHDCRRKGRELSCPDIGDLPPGHSLDVGLVWEAFPVDEIALKVHVGSETEDPDPENNSAREVTQVEAASADLALFASGPDELLEPGGKLNYSFRIANQGPGAAHEVTLKAELPEGTDLLSAQPDDCRKEGRALHCRFGSLKVGEGRELELMLGIGPEVDGPVSLFARVSAEEEDPQPDNNLAELTSLVNAKADLRLSNLDEADPVGMEETIVYLLKVGNKGPSQASEVELVDELSEAVEFVSAEAEEGRCEAEGRRVVCRWEEIGPRQDRLARIEARPLEEGSVKNFALVRSETDDPDRSNNQASEDTQIGDQGDVDGVADVIEDGAPNVGDGNGDGIPDRQQSNVASLPSSQTGEYLTVISRPGTALVEVQAEAPPESGSVPEGVDLPLGGLSFACRDLEPGQGTSISIIVHGSQSFNSYLKFGPTPEDPEPHWYDFHYDGVTGARFEGNRITLFLKDGLRGDDDLQVNGTIIDPGAPASDQRANLAVEFSDFPEAVTSGQEFHFALKVRNDGQTAAESVQLTSPLPDHSLMISAVPEQGGCSQQDGRIHCQLGKVPAGAEVGIEVTLMVERPGRLGSEAQVSSPRLDAQQENNHAQAESSVQPPLVLPLSLQLAGTLWEDTFMGVALFNPLADFNEVLLSGISARGKTRQEVTMPAMTLQAQTAFLAGERLSDPVASTLQAEGMTRPLQGFFLTGDNSLNRMDGLGGRLDESSSFHFPVVHSGEDVRTLLYLYNPGPGSARLTAVLSSPAGQELARYQRDLGPQASLLAEVRDLLQLRSPIQLAYLSIESDLPLTGFELISQHDSISALAAQPSRPVERLVVPHYFVDAQGGGTLLYLLNREAEAVSLRLRALDDTGAEVASLDRELPAGSLTVEDLSQLIQPQQGGIASGHLSLQVSPVGQAQPRPVEVLGAVSFQGEGFRSMLPLMQQGRLESLFLQVAQSPQLGVFTGCAIVNPGTQTAFATLSAFDQQGRLTGERLVEIAPGSRLVGMLDGPGFFGPGFGQTGGRFEVSSDQPLISFALFGDFEQNYLAAVESQEALR